MNDDPLEVAERELRDYAESLGPAALAAMNESVARPVPARPAPVVFAVGADGQPRRVPFGATRAHRRAMERAGGRAARRAIRRAEGPA